MKNKILISILLMGILSACKEDTDNNKDGVEPTSGYSLYQLDLRSQSYTGDCIDDWSWECWHRDQTIEIQSVNDSTMKAKELDNGAWTGDYSRHVNGNQISGALPIPNIMMLQSQAEWMTSPVTYDAMNFVVGYNQLHTEAQGTGLYEKTFDYTNCANASSQVGLVDSFIVILRAL